MARKKGTDDKEEKKRGGHFRRKYNKLRCSRCKQLGHNTRGCTGTTPNATERLKKRVLLERQVEGLKEQKKNVSDLGSGINWGYDTDAEEKKKKS